MEWDIVIGLEIHAQLNTKTKMFCRCSAETWNEAPNTHVCPVCLGLPGALPVANKEAIKKAILAGFALKGGIQNNFFFERKHYFYPDLPKGYQISQYQKPISLGGEVILDEQTIQLERTHLEEDTGKLLHVRTKTENYSLIDFNRSGIPLLEIVSKPEIRSPDVARSYAQKIQQLMRYSGVSNADMEKGSLRVDANISLKPKGEKKLGVKVEVKNMNSFRSLEKALLYEVKRQTSILEAGDKITQETRGWVEVKNETVLQRKKEEAHDYHYFPDPDLPPIEFKKEDLTDIKNKLGEMPESKIERFMADYALTKEQAVILCQTKEFADWYERAVQAYSQTEVRGPKEIYDVMVNDFLKFMNGDPTLIENARILPSQLAEVLYLRDKGELLRDGVKKVLENIVSSGESVEKVVTRLGLRTLKSDKKLEDLLNEVVSENEKAVLDFKAGKPQALGYLLGQIKRKSQNFGISPESINPNIAKSLLEKKIK